MRKLVCWLAILALVMSACGAMADNVLLLKEGSSSSKTVAVLQNDLISLGYLSGEPDGHYGEGTAEAVRAFREAHHLSPEGGVDTDMVVAIYEDQGRPTLTEGMRTMPVFAVQRVLVIAGFLGDTPDGAFGKGTLEAAKSYMDFAAEEMVLFAQQREDERTASLETLNATDMPVPMDEAIINAENVVTDGSINALWFDFILSGKVAYGPTLRQGDNSPAVKRMQLRLQALKYLAAGTDGNFGENTTRALKYFQYKNGLNQSGEFDPDTQAILYSDSAEVSDEYVSPYKAFVDTNKCRVYIAAWTGTGYDTTHLVKTMKCSPGKNSTPTKKGTFQASGQGGVRWWHMDGCWVQYPFIIDGGYFFHSLLYNYKGAKRPTSASVANLGHKASHGCVRLALDDSRWIYENCLPGMTVVIK